MPKALRILSVAFLILRDLSPLEWLVAVGLAAVGGYRWMLSPTSGLALVWPWWLAAILLLGCGLLAYGLDYTVWWPASGGNSDPMPAELPQPIRAIASGTFRDRENHTLVTAYHVPVQVRWLDTTSPPALAVLRPSDLVAGRNPLAEAEQVSLWHPGVDMARGLVASGWCLL